MRQTKPPLKLRLPATSANLGSCFDAAALALSLYLEIEAVEAAEFSIAAEGRNAEICSSLENNLLLETYRSALQSRGREIVPLAIRMRNEIPIGMGCGSSAAARLAGLAMAAHFGDVDFNSSTGSGFDGHSSGPEYCMPGGQQDDCLLLEAARLEGHPDNVAACWLGGFTVASGHDGRIYTATVHPPIAWSVLLVLPQKPLATASARALLPDFYTRADVVSNIQCAALLSLAFAQGRGDLLQIAMRDRVHQPYRGKVCPLLPRLLPLAGSHGILAAALSGAGPAVILILESREVFEEAQRAVLVALDAEEEVEFVFCNLDQHGTA